MKKYIATLILLIGLLCCGCNSEIDDKPQFEAITLTEEEISILDAMGSDVQVVSKGDYASVVNDISQNVYEHIGKVYQLEGILSIQTVHDEDTPYIIQNSEDQDAALGLPLRYLTKDIAVNTPIRVTAIVNVEDHDGHSHAVLEVVAIESVQ